MGVGSTLVEGTTVLVTDGGSGQGRSAVAAIRALGAAGYRPIVTTTGRHSLAAASRCCAGSVLTPPVTTPGYPDAVREAAARACVLTVLAASDAALVALDAPVGHLVDKAALTERAAAAGIMTPTTFELDDGDGLRAALERGNLSLPVVVKPVISSQPARLAASADEATVLVSQPGRFLVQSFSEGDIWSVSGVVAAGRVLAAVQQRYLRIWPVSCGTASAAVTVPVDEERLDALRCLLDGYEGVFQAQFAGEALIDVNPRVYGSLPLAVAAGVNLPAIWCAWLEGRHPAVPLRGRPGRRYRWLEGDIRHVTSGLRTGRLNVRGAVAALGPHIGTAHSVEALSDPGPLIARLRYAVGGPR